MASGSVVLAQGECDICGMPGIVGMSCSDPDCRGTVKDLNAKGKTTAAAQVDDDDDSDRYDKDLLEKEEEEPVSFEDLEDDERQEDDASYDDNDNI